MEHGGGPRRLRLAVTPSRDDALGMSTPEPLYYTADMVSDLIDESRPWPRHECVSCSRSRSC
jgi:hypothetical protein